MYLQVAHQPIKKEHIPIKHLCSGREVAGTIPLLDHEQECLHWLGPGTWYIICNTCIFWPFYGLANCSWGNKWPPNEFCIQYICQIRCVTIDQSSILCNYHGAHSSLYIVTVPLPAQYASDITLAIFVKSEDSAMARQTQIALCYVNQLYSHGLTNCIIEYFTACSPCSDCYSLCRV